MKKLAMLLRVVMFSLLLTACGQSVPPDIDVMPIENKIPTSDTQSNSVETEPLTESDSLAYPWMMPEVEYLGYEEFFAQEYDYRNTDAFTRTVGDFWGIGDDGSYVAYVLEADEAGFYICKNRDKENPLHRVPNTEGLTDCQKIITDTRKLYCIRDGELLRIDAVSGEKTVLYTAESVLDMVLCYGDVLYFLAKSDDILSLVRLYLPTMTTDLLYTGTAPNVPETWYRLLMPDTNRSTIAWEMINPAFWAEIQESIHNANELDVELAYPTALNLVYITEHPFFDEAVQHTFAQFQEALNLRPRMKCYYDPVADTYEEKYGIYDICFFGTGIHSDEEHFASYQEYND